MTVSSQHFIKLTKLLKNHSTLFFISYLPNINHNKMSIWKRNVFICLLSKTLTGVIFDLAECKGVGECNGSSSAANDWAG